MSALRDLRNKAGLSQQQLAELADTSQPQIKRLEDGERKLTREWAVRLAPHLNVSPEQILFPDTQRTVIAISGLVGAGGEVNTDLSLHYGDEVTAIEVDMPLSPDVFAFEVWGDSMVGRYEPGDIVLVRFGHSPEEALGDTAIVVTDDGNRYLKRVEKGSKEGLYNLESINPVMRTMRDVQLREVGLVQMWVPRRRVRRPVKEKEIKRRFTKTKPPKAAE